MFWCLCVPHTMSGYQEVFLWGFSVEKGECFQQNGYLLRTDNFWPILDCWAEGGTSSIIPSFSSAHRAVREGRADLYMLAVLQQSPVSFSVTWQKQNLCGHTVLTTRQPYPSSVEGTVTKPCPLPAWNTKGSSDSCWSPQPHSHQQSPPP